VRVLLIRHGLTDEVGHVLTGWKPGVMLNPEGRAQAERLAERLARVPLGAIYTSPIDRARQTAEAVARRQGLVPIEREALGEWRLGEWQGRRLEEMDAVAGWREFNLFRSGTRPPGGELAVEVQARVVGEIERLHRQHAGAVVAIVSHGDVIKAALFHYGGISLDLVLRFAIGPTSVTVIDLHAGGAAVLAVNDTGGPPWA
jgi:probable phosphoglycerate mutase